MTTRSTRADRINLRCCRTIALALAFAVCTSAASGADEAAPSTTPTLPPLPPLVQETVVDGSIDDVWRLFTTREGVESWMVPKARVDCRVGGTIRSTYDPSGSLDGPDAIVIEYLTLLPPRMLSLKTLQSPAGSPFKDALGGAWSVFEFEPLAADRVRVRVTGLGYGTSDEARAARKFFEKANAMTLDRLRSVLDRGVTAGQERVMELLRGFVGGEWIHESEVPGGQGVYRVRNVARIAPDRRGVVIDGWAGGDAGVHYHAATQIWQMPGSGVVRYRAINEDGTVASGALTLVSEGVVGWDWTAVHEDGRVQRYWIETVFDGAEPDRYRMRMFAGDRAVGPPAMEIEFKRVDRAPDRFRPRR